MTNLNPTTRRHEPGPRSPRSIRGLTGFSLIELLVVIAIIAVIAGLLLGGISKLKEGGKESHARTLVTNLIGNAGQYEVKTNHPIEHNYDIKLNWAQNKNTNAPGWDEKEEITPGYKNKENNGDYTYDNGDKNRDYMKQANLYIERFIWAVYQLPQIRDNLPALGSSFVDADDDGFMEVVDPWGNPIAYAYNVDHSDKYPQDDFLPEHPSPFFASAGKDQMWGQSKKRGSMSTVQWKAYIDTDEYKHTLDNLYSFDLDRAAATRGD